MTSGKNRFGVVGGNGEPERYRCYQCGYTQGGFLACEVCQRDPFQKPRHPTPGSPQ